MLAEFVARRVKDPDLEDTLLSFTDVDVSADLSHARVHVSVLGDEEQKRTVLAALERSEGFLHRQLMREMHIKRVPRLHFLLDERMEEADRITAMMRDIARSEGREF